MGKRILVVDDSHFMRKKLTDLLHDHGHTIIREAKDGQEAVRTYQKMRPDVVIMDINMRGKDGLEAVREIKAFDAGAEIVFLTILEDPDLKEKAERMGARGFVHKKDHRQILEIIDQI